MAKIFLQLILTLLSKNKKNKKDLFYIKYNYYKYKNHYINKNPDKSQKLVLILAASISITIPKK